MRLAVILFNLGGPDSPAAVQPFLRNLFRDPAIIGLPALLRLPLAELISRRRARVATEIYGRIGGRSPILPQTEAQATALDAALQRRLPQWQAQSFICMRYWHPMAEETLARVTAWRPDRILLLPLYPQLSTTTSQSSVEAWLAAAKGLRIPTQAVCCYPVLDGFVAAASDLIARSLQTMPAGRPWRLLFSAHGLPEKIVARGDPYPEQIQRSAAAIAARLGDRAPDWSVCYQSRVGPLKWIGPSTEQEIARAAADRRDIVLFPVSFVSEHSETLVELDIEYAELAHRLGIGTYRRVATVTTHPAFIDGLAGLVADTLGRSERTSCGEGTSAACGAAARRCPLRAEDPFALIRYNGRTASNAGATTDR